MDKKKVLLIDDEEQLRNLMKRIISLEGFEVSEASSLKIGLKKIESESPQVVLCDVKLPDGNGVAFVKEVRQQFPLTEFILLTAYGNIPDGVAAIKNGAFDYLTKGNDNDRIIPLLYQAFEKAKNNRQSAIKIKDKSSYDFSGITGNSVALQQALVLAKKIAPTDSTILLTGETGTGKEVFANAIHGNSKRQQHAIVAVNCSAFPKDLLESELFGHKAGAYTHAIKDKKGLLELADKGTLFLDEIGEMNIELQAKILRVLENGEFVKIGDEKISKVNVRIIAATHRDLKEAITQGLFREDLFYRLNVFSIHLPALRERTEDIPLLAKYFIAYFSERENKSVLSISNETIQILQKYNWPGNIRELRNVMERAVVLSDGDRILPEALPYEIQKQTGPAATHFSIASVEKKHIEKVLQHTRGNKTKTAELLGIGLTTLYRKIEEYAISI